MDIDIKKYYNGEDMKKVPLYQVIFNYYYNQIIEGKLESGQQIETELQICKMFHVSRITAKAAIDKLAEYGHVKRISGKGTFVIENPNTTITPKKAVNKKIIIGVVLCDIDYSFGFEVLRGIEESSAKKEIHFIFRRSFESLVHENEIIKDMVSLGVDGLIIQTVHGEIYNQELLKLFLNGFPIVLIDRHMDKTRAPFVTTNNFSSAEKMTEYLIALGYKNISYCSSDSKGTSTLQGRYDGFKSALLSHNKSYRSKKMDLLTLKTPETREKNTDIILADTEMIYNHIEQNKSIDCIFAAEYYVAKLVYDVALKLGKRVPEDLGIVCFDAEKSDFSTPFFTHMSQQQYHMGEIAVDMIHDQIKGVYEDNKYQHFLDGEIVVGNSTKKQ